MIDLKDFFKDDYDRETLLAPTIAVILPAIAVISLLGFNTSVAFGFTVLGVQLASVPVWMFASSVREKGKALEEDIFKDGIPTTKALRLREIADYNCLSRRAKIQQITGVSLLSKKQEIEKVDEADQRILHAVGAAKEKMRDQQEFFLLRRELKSYGFWRNIVAVRSSGLFVSTLSLLLSFTFVLITSAEEQLLPIIAAIVAASACTYWLFITVRSRVVVAADRYKEQFFKSLDQIQ